MQRMLVSTSNFTSHVHTSRNNDSLDSTNTRNLSNGLDSSGISDSYTAWELLQPASAHANIFYSLLRLRALRGFSTRLDLEDLAVCVGAFSGR
jgi:hypothetical protein